MSESPSSRRRISVPAARLERWLVNFVERHGQPVWTLDGDVVHGVTGDSEVWLTVPFPPLDGAEPATALVAHASRPRRIGVLLVRRGGHACGVFDGAELVDSKVGSSYVQGTTKAGGWSQQRFARRRDNQARAAFGDAADTAFRVLVPAAGTLDALVCGGDRPAVEAVLADPRLKALGPLVRAPWLAVPDPRLKVLKETPPLFTAVAIEIAP